MMFAEESLKAREGRLRRMAGRHGLVLQKSRRRDPRAHGYGTYQLVDPQRNVLVAGDPDVGYGLDLDDVERQLTSTDLTLGFITSVLAGISSLVTLGGRLLTRSTA